MELFLIAFTCIRVGWGSVAQLHEDKLQLCDVETIGAMDTNPQRKNVIEDRGIKSCPTYEQAQSLNPDFWDICVPNHQHLPVIEKIVAFDPEAYILVEKPVCNPEQIGKLRTVLKGFRGKVVVNENYLSSKIADRVKGFVSELQLTHKKVIIEMDKNRTQDFKKGRYLAKTVFGYEGTHMMTILQNLGPEYAPKKDTPVEIRWENIEIPERLEKQGLVDITYTVNGVVINLFTAMNGKIKHRFAPHCPTAKSINANDTQTRYRIAAIEGLDENDQLFTVIGFYEPIRRFKRSIGSVVVLNEKGEVIKREEPIDDDTMGRHLQRAVDYFRGKGNNPCSFEKGIETVELLHALEL